MMRRPWLAVVVLVLLGINTAMLAHAARTCRPDDAIVVMHDDDIAPCEVIAPVVEPELVAIVAAEQPPVTLVGRTGEVIAIAPKTSPPR